MKNLINFTSALVLVIALVGFGFASDLSQEMNNNKSNVITKNSPYQKSVSVSPDNIQVFDKFKFKNDAFDLARRGCCSHHGGVCGCDEASGMIKCCDGTLSPTCTCSGY